MEGEQDRFMGQIKIYNSGDAETDAYLMALYSRSLKSIDEHVEKIDEEKESALFDLIDKNIEGYRERNGADSLVKLLKNFKSLNTKAKEFHRKFTIGYGHKSIAECGHVNVYFEGIPAYLAPYIQHSTLYSGIEASTRYIDFSNVNGRESKIVNDFLTSDSFAGDFCLPSTSSPEALQAKIRKYKATLQGETDRLLNQISERPEGISDTQWLKACKAKATDIARGFLPIGVLTNVGYSASLKEIAELVFRLPENLGQGEYFGISNREIIFGLCKIRRCLVQAIKDSGHDIILRDEVLKCEYDMRNYYLELCDYTNNSFFWKKDKDNAIMMEWSPLFALYRNKDSSKIDLENPSYRNRGKKFNFNVQIDFAGFRDIHRHRLINFTMPTFPKLDEEYFLNPYYGDSQVRTGGKSISELEFGINVVTEMIGQEGALAYFVRTRCNETAHPTVRQLAYGIGKELDWRNVGDVAKINLGKSFYNFKQDTISIKRGQQDIVENNK